AGKNVLLVDDSMVRGTTSREIIQMARDAGARTAYFASAAPPVRYPNVYGIAMPIASELIAHGRSLQEVCGLLGADRLVFQDLDDLVASVRVGNPHLSSFDASVSTGDSVTGHVGRSCLDSRQECRSDSAPTLRRRRE